LFYNLPNPPSSFFCTSCCTKDHISLSQSFSIMRLSIPALAANVLFAASALHAYDSAPRAVQVKGYYPSFNFAGQRPAAINWPAFTDVLFFMVEPKANFTLAYHHKLTFNQGEQLVTEFVAEARKHRVNPVVSFGGWDGSGSFSILTRSDASRKRLAKMLVDYAKKHGFVGIEMDWEYPNSLGIGCNTKDPNDTVNFGKLTKEIRTLWPEASLTIAMGITGLIGANGSPATATETALLAQNLNAVNLMAYDVYGAWAPTTGPLAPLHATCAPPDFALSAETGLQVALKQGFKPSQIIMGIPGYAKRLELTSPTLVPKTVSGQTTFYYQNHTKVTPPGGKFDDKPGKDVCGVFQNWSGSFLVTEMISNGWLSQDQKTGLNGYKRQFDACSGQPFLTNGKYFFTYDDIESTVNKAKFAKQNRLGGIYFYDTMGPAPATIQAAGRAFRG